MTLEPNDYILLPFSVGLMGVLYLGKFLASLLTGQ